MLFRNPFPIRIDGYVFAAFLVAALAALIDPIDFAMHVALFAALLMSATLAGLLLGAAVYAPALLVCWLYRGEPIGKAARSASRASCATFRGTLEFVGSFSG